MRDVVAVAAIDGVLVASNSAETPFTLRIVGGDPRRTTAADWQLWIAARERMFQVTVVPATDVLAKGTKLGGDREVLNAHAAWECKHHNEMLHLEQTAHPQFLEIGKRTWSHWTYDLSALAKRLKEESKEAGGQNPGPRTQHLITTVVGKHIVVLISTTMIGEEEADTKNGLINAAKTLVVYPKPLSPTQLKQLCEQRQ